MNKMMGVQANQTNLRLRVRFATLRKVVMLILMYNNYNIYIYIYIYIYI